MPPANDNFVNAQVISALSGSFTVADIMHATTETGERYFNKDNGADRTAFTVWFKWTSPSTPVGVSLDTAGTNYDNVLAVYTGPDVAHLSLVLWSGDTNPATTQFTSRVHFNPEPNTTYYFQVGAFAGAGGMNSGNALVFNYSILTAPVRLFIATWPPLPASNDQPIRWVGRVDSGVFNNTVLLRATPTRIEVKVAAAGPQDGRTFDIFNSITPRVPPSDYVGPSSWASQSGPDRYGTFCWFNVQPVVGIWSGGFDTITGVRDCIIHDSLGSYSVDSIEMVTTVRAPSDAAGYSITTVCPNLADYRPFGNGFLVTADEHYAIGCRGGRADLTTGVVDSAWPHLSGLNYFSILDINSDGSFFASASLAVSNLWKFVLIASDGSAFIPLFDCPDSFNPIGGHWGHSTARYVYGQANTRSTIVRVDRATGAVVDTRFFVDSANFPWNSLGAPLGWDNWSVGPDDTLWFALDGPSFRHQAINQCVAKVTSTDDWATYAVEEIPVQAMVDTYTTGFSQGYTWAWGVDKDGNVLFPSMMYEDSTYYPQPAQQAWFLKVAPDGTVQRAGGTWDFFGTIPPANNPTDGNVADGPVGVSASVENDYSCGAQYARTALYFLEFPVTGGQQIRKLQGSPAPAAGKWGVGQIAWAGGLPS